jgi:signal transduction histidine kinase/AraC-like DNA-binding protein/streptogramin lyase
MLKPAVLSLAWLIGIYAYTQKPLYTNHAHYTTEDGLPQNYVSSIVQDHDGFIWVSTLDGIARFDGKKFLEFNINSDSGQKISTPRVIDLKVDKDNNLWILHFNQKVDRINPETFEVQRDLTPVSTAEHDEFPLAMGYRSMFYFTFAKELDNTHWFVKNRFTYHLFDSVNQKLSKLFTEKKARSTNFFAFDEDSKGRLWILEQKGLSVSDTNWENFRTIQPPEELHFDFDSVTSLSFITQLTKERMLMFAGERLIIYNEPINQFRELKLPIRRSENANHATVATKDQEGRVVFAYYGYVFRVNEDESISTLWKFPERERFLISSLLISHDGTLWIGINTGGLYRVNMLVPSFKSKEYDQNFLVDLLTNEMGVDDSQIPINWFQNKGSYDFRYFYSDNGRLYFTQDGYYFGRHRRIFYLYNNSVEVVKSKLSTHYFKGFNDQNGFLTAIDSYGYYYNWDDTASDPEISKCIDLGIPNNFQLIDMTFADGYDWVLDSQNRVYKLENGKKIKTFKVGDENFGLIQLYKDPTAKYIFWMATYGGGLLKWNYQKDEIEKVFTKDEGLPDNTIAAMVPDGRGNIWMSTFNGISKFNPVSERFTNYTTSDGLIQSEFDRHHGFKLPDGRIAFGGTNGYSVFHPNEFADDDKNPKTSISSISVNDEPFRQIKKYQKASLNELSEIKLPYDQNNISLDVAAMQYASPSKNRYRYKLEGFNDNWVNNGDNRTIRFDNLSPGKYSLFLNSSNTNEIWSSSLKKLVIRISPPWWLSWWAYSIYFITCCSIIFIYWRSYKRNLIRKQDEEFNKREARRLKEVDDMKTRFFSNITHEFRTPLTLILSPLEKQLRDKKYPAEVQKMLESNYRHGSHLLKLVNELLDISKLESGFMQQHKSTGLLDQFAKDCLMQFENFAERKNIHLMYSSEGVHGHYQFDKAHWEKIISNLLSNAIKFTDDGGKVSMHLKEVGEGTEHKIHLAVRDTGIGIHEEQINKLFDRFYQVDDSSTRVQEGTGIGLSLVKELTELMQGTVEVKSRIGEGTTFQLVIPIEKLNEKKRIELSALENGVENFDNKESEEGGLLILVVEDNTELREFIVDSLAEKWTVLEAANGVEGREKMYESLPDIIVSDVMMPEMNGYDLCKVAKEDFRTSHIHFLLLTAKTAQESKVLGLEAGADDYLTKPFQLYELELRIQNALQKQENFRKKLMKDLLPSEPTTTLPKVEDAFLSNLYSYLDANLTNPQLGVESLAEKMAMSQSTLNRKLKALLNLSAVELIKNYRIQKAASLITTGDTISRISHQVGFESASYFSQCFRDVYDMTPSEFQRQVI